jgi:hypothetical protein
LLAVWDEGWINRYLATLRVSGGTKIGSSRMGKNIHAARKW